MEVGCPTGYVRGTPKPLDTSNCFDRDMFRTRELQSLSGNVAHRFVFLPYTVADHMGDRFLRSVWFATGFTVYNQC